MSRLSQEERRELTRERLRTAALREFAQHGVGGTSVDRISEAAGLSRGAFYHNYAGKYELLLELLHEHQAQAIQHTLAMISQSSDLEQVFSEMTYTFDSYEQDGDWILLAVELRLHAQRDPQFAGAWRPYELELQAVTRELYTSVFQKAGKQPPADIDSLATLLERVSRGLRFRGDDRWKELPGQSQTPGELFVLVLRGLTAVAAPVAQVGLRPCLPEPPNP